MKFLTGCLVILMLAAATGADAWPWNRKPKRLPDAIDSPVVRPKNKNLGRPKGSDHKAEHDRMGWGEEKRLTNLKNPKEGNHSIYQNCPSPGSTSSCRKRHGGCASPPSGG